MMISCEPPDSPSEADERYDEDKSKDIRAKLAEGVPVEQLKSRKGPGNQSITYIEGHTVIEQANAIFGYNGWSSDIVDITVDFMEEANKRWQCGVTAIVRITLASGEAYHEDLGFGSSVDSSRATCIGHAKKSAVTDAMKRALRCFGDALGNSVYSKEKVKQAKDQARDQMRNAAAAAPPPPPSRALLPPPPAPPPQARGAPAAEPGRGTNQPPLGSPPRSNPQPVQAARAASKPAAAAAAADECGPPASFI